MALALRGEAGAQVGIRDADAIVAKLAGDPPVRFYRTASGRERGAALPRPRTGYWINSTLKLRGMLNFELLPNHLS